MRMTSKLTRSLGVDAMRRASHARVTQAPRNP
jgi:hypothetical protein